MISYIVTFAAGLLTGGLIAGAGVWATLTVKYVRREQIYERRLAEARADAAEAEARAAEAQTESLARLRGQLLRPLREVQQSKS